MNLRKMSKRALIAEIRRLRTIEIQRDELREEIYRRDEATKNWKLITPLACVIAHQLANCETLGQQSEVWERFWQFMNIRIEGKRINQFWAERCADLADEYKSNIISYGDTFKSKPKVTDPWWNYGSN